MGIKTTKGTPAISPSEVHGAALIHAIDSLLFRIMKIAVFISLF